MLDFSGIRAIIQKLSEQQTEYGGIAQLGERLNGIQEVSGSIPLISTKNTDFCYESRCFSNFLKIFVLVGQHKGSISGLFAVERRSKWLIFKKKIKGKKIVSFKFKTCLGRDANGKQIFKCATWQRNASFRFICITLLRGFWDEYTAKKAGLSLNRWLNFLRLGTILFCVQLTSAWRSVRPQRRARFCRSSHNLPINSFSCALSHCRLCL